MNTFYAVALSFTACSFAVFIINYFIPNGNLKNISTLVLVLFVIVSAIKPIKEIKLKKSEYINEYTETEFNTESNNAGIIKSNLRKLTADALKENGIDDYELIIDLDIYDGEVVIKEYTIKIENINMSETVKKTVSEKTGIEPEVVRIK